LFSVLILTLNEENNLPFCLSSIANCDDIVILDSGSTDRTIEIAKASRARVFSRPFDNFANQRNWAHKNIQFKYNWVFHLDADERMTSQLVTECAIKASSDDSSVDGFFVAPQMLWRGVWVPRSTDFPAFQARFVHSKRFIFIQSGHGQREHPSMKMQRLVHNYKHEMCSEGTDNWLQKHKKYARQEAERYFADKSKPMRYASALFFQGPLERRRALKHLSYVTPARPLVRFIYQFFFRLGFLDGKAGLEYCLLIARYEGFASIELRAIKREGRQKK